jgi:lipid A disaccharide synthetase
MQDEFTGNSLSRELILLLAPERIAQMREELTEVAKRIGEPGASERAARAIVEFINTVSEARP